jgi:transcriptional regulator with XRE-family HTH domain
VADEGENAFGQLLTELREVRGWTKTQLAERAGLDPSSVSRLEAGFRAPEPRTVEVLVKALGISPVEHERLLARAGFRSLAWNDPMMVELVELLVDPTVPAEIASDLRILVKVAVEHGKRAASNS